MKKIIAILIFLIAFVSLASAQVASKKESDTREVDPRESEVFTNMEDDYARDILIENERIAEYHIKFPGGFKTFYNKTPEEFLSWENDNGNSTDLYMSKKRIDDGASIEIVYDRLYDSIRVYYICPRSSFDLARATHAVDLILTAFLELKEFETEDGGTYTKPRYFSYKHYHGNDKYGQETEVKNYLGSDGKTKYTRYYAHIKFFRTK